MELGVGRNPALTIAIALAVGMVSQAAARHARIPGIVVLLAAGVVLGPEMLGLVRPETLGGALQLIVGMSVAVILFEGGLNLSLHRLRREAVTIRRLVTLGVLVTGLGGTLAARWLLGWDWSLAVLFGSLVTVTGPTVMTPLLRRIDVNLDTSTVLEAEGLLIDPVGAVVAVVALEVVLTTSAHAAGPGAGELLGLPSRLVLGAVVGLVGGGAIGAILQRQDLVPEGYENVLVLSLVLVLFEVSEALQPESGIMAAAVAGIVVGNVPTALGEDLREFKEQLTVMLIGLLFVLLAATVRLEAVMEVGWGGLATIAALMFVVRPVDVALCTWGSDLSWRERAFIAWLAPRGIVAAAMASLFAQWLSLEGVGGGEQLQAMVFLVIAVTVVVQGGTGRLVAEALGVQRELGSGYLVAGANVLGRALARALRVAGEDVVLVDASARECEAAEREGLDVVYGDAGGERALRQARADYRRGAVVVTPNSALNVLLAQEIRERTDVEEVYVALDRRHSDVSPVRLEGRGDRLLFGRPLDLSAWRHRLEHGLADLGAWSFGAPGEAGGDAAGPDGGPAPAGAADRETEGGVLKPFATVPEELLPLVHRRDGVVRPAARAQVLEEGDVVYFAWPYEAGQRVGRWLAEKGWRPELEAG